MCVFVSTLCKYDLRKGDLLNYNALSWARVRRVCMGSVSSLVLIGDGGVQSIRLFCRLARCFVNMVVCIVVSLVFMSCSIMVFRFVPTFVGYLMLYNVVCFLSLGGCVVGVMGVVLYL